MDTWVFVCVMREVGRRHLYVALYIKKKLYLKKINKKNSSVEHGYSCLSRKESSRAVRETEGGKKVYILFYIVQNIYRPFVPLKSCSVLAMPSALYHVIIIHRLVLMTRGWFDCFFMSSAFFAINAFVLKQLFSVFFSLHVACSFMIIMKEEVAESIHIYVLLVQKQGYYLYSPLRFHSWPLENPSWRVILYLAIIIIILWKAVGATLQVWLSAYH